MAFLERAVELAVRSVDECGGPFGAVIVRDGTELACGENRVTRDHDPSAHAEVVAIRRAGAALGSHVLTGCVLYASCE
ncbi:MAG TPA: deaminase, partial [Microlunatus sp.]|nr:deaminase [Microlunatus sp.]